MENKQNSDLQENQTTKRILPYNRQFVVIAIYEVLDKSGAKYEKTDSSTITAELSVYGNRSRFSISVGERESGTELLVTMVHPCEGLSSFGIQRAITAVADNISQYLENEIVMNSLNA